MCTYNSSSSYLPSQISFTVGILRNFSEYEFGTSCTCDIIFDIVQGRILSDPTVLNSFTNHERNDIKSKDVRSRRRAVRVALHREVEGWRFVQQ